MKLLRIVTEVIDSRTLLVNRPIGDSCKIELCDVRGKSSDSAVNYLRKLVENKAVEIEFPENCIGKNCCKVKCARVNVNERMKVIC